MLMGAAHDALRASNARVSLTCLYVIARRVPRPLCGQVGIARSRRGGHGALAVAEEDTTIQCSYAQAVDGIVLDTEGYTPGGGSEVIPGTRVDVYQDGRVSIQNPLRVGQKTRTLSKADLMDIEEVQDLCRIYYENCGLPCVTVVTGGGLVYYSSDGELRPAWSLEETWYPSENGHITSQMLDGQTGEYLRQ